MICWRREEENSQPQRYRGAQNSFHLLLLVIMAVYEYKTVGICHVHPVSPAMMWLCQGATFCYFIYFKNMIWYVEKNIPNFYNTHHDTNNAVVSCVFLPISFPSLFLQGKHSICASICISFSFTFEKKQFNKIYINPQITYCFVFLDAAFIKLIMWSCIQWFESCFFIQNYFLRLSVLWSITVVHSFSLSYSIPLFEYTIIYSSSCMRNNDAGMFLHWDSKHIGESFSRAFLGVELLRCSVTWTFTFIRWYQRILQGIYTSLHSPQQWGVVSAALHPHQHLLSSDFFPLTNSVTMKGTFMLVLLCISLMTNEVEHLFIHSVFKNSWPSKGIEIICNKHNLKQVNYTWCSKGIQAMENSQAE